MSIEKIETEQKQDTKKQVYKRIAKVICFLIWLYMLAKLLVFDFEKYIISRYLTNYSWLNYLTLFKTALLIIACIIIYLLIKKKRWLIYLLFYPIILLFYEIPYFIIKKKIWFLLVAYLRSIISLFTSLKFILLSSSILTISCLIIVLFSNVYIIYSSIFILTIFVLIINIRAILIAFKSSTESMIYGKIKQKASDFPNKISEYFRKSTEKNKELTHEEKLDQERIDSLQTNIICNRCIVLLANKLRVFNSKKYNILLYIFTTLMLVIFNVLIFAVIYYGLFKVDSLAFIINIDYDPKMFNFMFYSFNSLFGNTIYDIVPLSTMSKILQMIESFSAFIIIAVFIGLVIPFISNKRSNEIESIIVDMDKAGEFIEEFIKQKYNIQSIQLAIEELGKAKSSMISFIQILSKGIE